jgi:hypothetical protein
MTLIDFDTDLSGSTRVVVTKEVVPTVTETLTTTLAPSAKSTHVLKGESEWGWEELRDYVVSSIEKRHGAFPRNYKTEASIFKAFISRWGSQAPAIARFAFEFSDGMWHNAPISVNRFCKASDAYFAVPISQRLS